MEQELTRSARPTDDRTDMRTAFVPRASNDVTFERMRPERMRPEGATPKSTTSEGMDRDDLTWCHRAIVFLDAVNYSALIDRSPARIRARVRAMIDEAERLARDHDGRLVERAGDGAFLEFPDPPRAVTAMHAFLDAAHAANIAAAQAANAARETAEAVLFRVGMTYGDVLHDGEVPAGPVVNSAKRLETLAEPGAMNVSGNVHAALAPHERERFRDGGFRVLKGQAVPVRVWRSVRVGLPGVAARGGVAAPGGATGSVAAPGPDAETSVEPNARPGTPEPSVEPGTEPSAVELAHAHARETEPEAETHSIAVLRFRSEGTASPDGGGDYFATGLAADIVAGLSRVRSLLIVSPRTSLTLDTRGRAPCDVARELGVRYLVEGHVIRHGERLRVMASLVSCPSDQIVWSHSYDRDVTDLFAIQDDIAGAIVATIEPAFWRAEWERAAQPEQRNLAHWDLLMRANWSFWRSSRAANRDAQAMAEQALALKPDDCSTHGLLAMCRAQRVWANWSPDPQAELEAGVVWAREAVRLDPYNARGHFTLGATLTLAERLDEAAACQRRALELNPHFAASMGELGRIMTMSGRTQEARDLSLKAIRRSACDPHLALWIRNLALADFVDGDYEGAVRFALEAASSRPNWFFNHHMLTAALHLAGREDEARAAMGEAMRLKPRYTAHAMRSVHPFADPAVSEQFVAALRAAGWDG